MNTLTDHRGSCKCKAVRFTAQLDLSMSTMLCNCTICSKTGWWSLRGSASTFRIDEGEAMLAEYSPSSATHIRFCKRCGTSIYGFGHIPEMGGDYLTVSVRALDDVDVELLSVTCLDGLHDTWAPLYTGPYRDPCEPRGAPAV